MLLLISPTLYFLSKQNLAIDAVRVTVRSNESLLTPCHAYSFVLPFMAINTLSATTGSYCLICRDPVLAVCFQLMNFSGSDGR